MYFYVSFHLQNFQFLNCCNEAFCIFAVCGRLMSAAAVSDESYSSHQIEFEFEMPCRRDANIHIVAGSLPTRLTVSPERLAILWAVHDVESEFEHISQLGIGQFGQVSLMRRVKTDEICAVKRVHHQPTLQRSRLQSERACLRALSHPFIVQWYATSFWFFFFFFFFSASGKFLADVPMVVVFQFSSHLLSPL